MTDASNQAEQISARFKARPLLNWGLRAIAVLSAATGVFLWPQGWPIDSSATPTGFALLLGVMTHYLRKAIFGIPLFSSRSLLDDAVAAFSALTLAIAAQALMIPA